MSKSSVYQWACPKIIADFVPKGKLKGLWLQWATSIQNESRYFTYQTRTKPRTSSFTRYKRKKSQNINKYSFQAPSLKNRSADSMGQRKTSHPKSIILISNKFWRNRLWMIQRWSSRGLNRSGRMFNQRWISFIYRIIKTESISIMKAWSCRKLGLPLDRIRT